MALRTISYTGTTFVSLAMANHEPTMFYREAIQNGIEASKTYRKLHPELGSIDILIRKLDVKDLLEPYECLVYNQFTKEYEFDKDKDYFVDWTDKLSFLNYGGMDDKELRKILDLGGSGKTTGLNQNFGIGIKASVLNWSDLLIITRKNNVGRYTRLTKIENGDNPLYVSTIDGVGYRECTDWINENTDLRNYPKTEDFTEVVILGRSETQDTYYKTFDLNSTEHLPVTHIRKHICQRYFKLPDNINIKLHHSVNKRKSTTLTDTYIEFSTFFKAYNDSLSRYPDIESQYHREPVGNGITIHYFWDAPCGNNFVHADKPGSHGILDQQGWSTTFSGQIWKDEIYDVKVDEGGSWIRVANKLGIQKDYRYFRVFIEYDDSYATTADATRETLKRIDNNHKLYFDSDESINLILLKMPDWFKEKINITKQQTARDIDEALKTLIFNKLNINESIKLQSSASNTTLGIAKRGSPSDTNNSVDTPLKLQQPNQFKQRNFSKPKYFEPKIPIVVAANDDEIDQLLCHKYFAAVYEGSEANQFEDKIIYNPNHKRIEELSKFIIQILAYDNLTCAIDEVRNEMILHIASWVITNRSELQNNNIDPQTFEHNITPGQLNTIILDKEDIIIENAKSIVKERKLLANREHTLIPITE